METKKKTAKMKMLAVRISRALEAGDGALLERIARKEMTKPPKDQAVEALRRAVIKLGRRKMEALHSSIIEALVVSGLSHHEALAEVGFVPDEKGE